MLKKYCEYFVGLYKKISEPNWQWFEDILAYSNGVIPESLLLAYKRTGDQNILILPKPHLIFSHSIHSR